MKKLACFLLAVMMVVSCVACAANATTPAATTAKPVDNTPSAPTVTEEPEESEEPEKAEEPVETAPVEVQRFDGEEIEFCIVSGDEALTTEAWGPIIDAFYEETGCKVNLSFVSNDVVKSTAMARCAAGDAADVFQVNQGNETEFINQGYLEPMNQYFSKEVTDTMVQWNNSVASDGEHYVVPFSGGQSFRVVLMNVDLCKELGLEVPAYDAFTWDTLIEYGKAAVAAGYRGYLTPFGGNANNIMENYMAYLHQAGGSWYDEEGNWNLDSEASIAAFQFIKDLFDNNLVDSLSYTDDGVIEEFKSGDALFCAVASYLIPSGYGDSLSFTYDGYHMQGKTYGTSNVCDNISMFSGSQHKEAAAAWMNFLFRPENFASWYVKINGNAGNILNNLDTVEGIEVPGALDAPIMHLCTDPCDKWWTSPSKEGSSEVWNVTGNHQQLVAMGDETPEEAANALQAAVLAAQ